MCACSVPLSPAALPLLLQEGARCVQWVSPDAVQLVQLLLLASGFQSGPALATALIDVWRELQLMVCSLSLSVCV